ncbi:RecX family transcriptional regulator [Chitinophaga caeni]|uniref:Regulatory protein RecX n=1 Tax=Chitinophaga caeni TaxID=2029983 RepID=A0A291QQS4_9BACT|nr:regulatory protein RecX [Chitinophaga caeni]ATL46310.1 RecX family transcriptional regulator [Chitinophaga caeni]
MSIRMQEVILQKLKHYCAYQERCHKDVRDKCYELGVRGHEQDELLAQLVEENFLNEERFARAFAGGKFRLKRWGKNKIKAALKMRDISGYCINKAMEEIDMDDYMKTLNKEAAKKFASVKETKEYQKKYKTLQYLMQRGFEQDLARQAIEEIANQAGK